MYKKRKGGSPEIRKAHGKARKVQAKHTVTAGWGLLAVESER